MTSFPQRINLVPQTLKSLLGQSVLPSMIIVYLSEKQFPDRQLPRELLSLLSEEVRVQFVADDFRAYKKLIYALDYFPNCSIVTCDDDVIYHPNWLKALTAAASQNPACVICTSARQITYAPDGLISPYKNWPHARHSSPSLTLLPIGVGGVLYPPGSLCELINSPELFMQLSPMNDDLWFKMMSFKNQTPVVRTATAHRMYTDIPVWEGEALANYNVAQGGNDNQFEALLSYFKVKPQEIAELASNELNSY